MPENPSKPDPPREEAPDRYIYVVPSSAVGEETVVVRKAGRNVYPVWTPDSAHIIFQAANGLWGASVANGKASGTPALISQLFGEHEPVGMTSNGTFYYETYAAGSSVEIISLSSDSVRPAEKIPGALNVAWSADGKFLALAKLNSPNPSTSQGLP